MSFLPRIMAAAALTVACLCCSPSNTTPETPPDDTPLGSISLTPGEKECSEKGEVFSIEIQSDSDWIVTSGATWITTDYSAGSGNGRLEVIVEENLTASVRQDSLVFALPGKRGSAVFRISQKTYDTGDVVTATVSARLTDGPDHLILEWDAISQADGYAIEVYGTNGTLIGSTQLESSSQSYIMDRFPAFLAEAGAAQYIGNFSAKVKAVFHNPLSKAESELLQCAHSHFDPASGNGLSDEAPFRISKPRHLSAISQVPSGHFLQTSDIDFTGINDFSPIAAFSGTYDGGGHGISRLSLSGSKKIALFSELTGGGILKNIRLVNPSIESTAAGEACSTGALCGILATNETGGIFILAARSTQVVVDLAHRRWQRQRRGQPDRRACGPERGKQRLEHPWMLQYQHTGNRLPEILRHRWHHRNP